MRGNVAGKSWLTVVWLFLVFGLLGWHRYYIGRFVSASLIFCQFAAAWLVYWLWSMNFLKFAKLYFCGWLAALSIYGLFTFLYSFHSHRFYSFSICMLHRKSTLNSAGPVKVSAMGFACFLWVMTAFLVKDFPAILILGLGTVSGFIWLNDFLALIVRRNLKDGAGNLLRQ